MAGTVVADTIRADSTSTLVLRNGVANTPPTIQDSAGTQIGTFCRAWVNFNGTTNVGGFCTIRASFNVTSVADNGTGDYTVNITNALPDANYNVVGALGGTTVLAVDIGILAANAPTTTTLRFGSRRTTDGALIDATYANISIFR
jgi:hypothetical protein